MRKFHGKGMTLPTRKFVRPCRIVIIAINYQRAGITGGLVPTWFLKTLCDNWLQSEADSTVRRAVGLFVPLHSVAPFG